MIPSRPYLIRAFYNWITDNLWTPYILVDATFADVMVPTRFVKDGKIVLNMSFNAVRDLEMTNTEVTFTARFSGRSENIFVPVAAVEAIYASENGKGMHFTELDMYPPDESAEVDQVDPLSVPSKKGKKGPPHLKIVK